MNIYETTFIVNPHSDDAAIERQVAAVTDIIKQAGGKIIRENLMGTRRLSYPIANLTQGYYANFIFEAPSSVLPLIERHFKLEDPYIRHLLIRFDGDPRLLDPEFEPIPFADLRHGRGGRDDDREERGERGERGERPFRGGRRPEGGGRPEFGGRRPERSDFRGRTPDSDRPRRDESPGSADKPGGDTKPAEDAKPSGDEEL